MSMSHYEETYERLYYEAIHLSKEASRAMAEGDLEKAKHFGDRFNVKLEELIDHKENPR